MMENLFYDQPCSYFEEASGDYLPLGVELIEMYMYECYKPPTTTHACGKCNFHLHLENVINIVNVNCDMHFSNTREM